MRKLAGSMGTGRLGRRLPVVSLAQFDPLVARYSYRRAAGRARAGLPAPKPIELVGLTGGMNALGVGETPETTQVLKDLADLNARLKLINVHRKPKLNLYRRKGDIAPALPVGV